MSRESCSDLTSSGAGDGETSQALPAESHQPPAAENGGERRVNLSGRIDCGHVLPGTIESKAKIGDLAVARMRNKWFDERFVVGVVTAATDAGHVKAIATARKRPSWEYDAQTHVGDRKKLRGLTAEQIAHMIPGSFTSFDDAYAAIIEILKGRAP